MSLPPGLFIILTEGFCSDMRNRGIFDNLNDLKKEIKICTLKHGKYLSKPLKIIQYRLVNTRIRSSERGGYWKIYSGKKFPTSKILNHLQVDLRLYVTWSDDMQASYADVEFNFEWHVLNNKYDEFLYAPGGQKYKEAEEKINQLSQN